MTNNDQAAANIASSAKLDWVKPELEMMADLADSKNLNQVGQDASNNPSTFS